MKNIIVVALAVYANLLMGVEISIKTTPEEARAARPPSPLAAEERECTADLGNGKFVTIKLRDKNVTLYQSAPNARYAPVKYKIVKKVNRTMPTEEPIASCGGGKEKMTIWDGYFYVSGRIFHLAEQN